MLEAQKPQPTSKVLIKSAGRLFLVDQKDICFASIEDVKALLEPRARKLAGAIVGRALYDGRLDPAAALALIRSRPAV